MSLTQDILLRLRVPATPTELAVTLGAPLSSVRSILYAKRERGLVRRLDRVIRRPSRRGRQYEYLWESA